MNKLTKLLSVFLIAGLVGTGAAAAITFSGCGDKDEKPDEETHQPGGGNTDNPGGGNTDNPGGGNTDNPGGGEQTHTHTAAEEWKRDKTYHWHLCTAGDGEIMEKAEHNYTDSADADCNDCGYERLVIRSYTDEVTLGGHISLFSNSKNVEWSITSGAEHASIDISGVLTGVSEGDVVVKAKDMLDNKKTATYTVHVMPTQYVTADFDCNFCSDVFAKYNSSGSKTTSLITSGRFTLGSGVYVENATAGLKFKNGDVNTQTALNAVSFELKGLGSKNAISFSAKGSKGNVIEIYKQTDQGDKKVASVTLGSSDVEKTVIGYDFEGNADGTVELTAGKYYMGSKASLRIGELNIKEYVPTSDPSTLNIAGAKKDFLVGEDFASTGLTAVIENLNSTQTAVDATKCVVDSSAVDMTKAGVYDVKVSYQIEGGNIPMQNIYPVYVYAIAEAQVGFYKTNGAKQTTFQNVYLAGQTFSDEGLIIRARGEAVDADGKTHENWFILNNKQFTVSYVDLTTTGNKEVTVSVNATEISTKFNVKVVEPAQITDNTVNIEVGADKTFTTITQALNYIKANKDTVADTVIKKIVIDDGVYNEKVCVDIPNVHLIGKTKSTVAAGQIGAGEDKNNKTVIVFGALAGTTDPAGTKYGTNGSGTVTVTATATGFRAENITFKNEHNTIEKYTASSKLTGDTQACALVVESPSAEFYNCKLTSYHDTLYSNKGNHYYKDCYIEGRTDFIFGQDANVYFDGCTIYTVSAGASDGSGGYVCALKPSSDNNTTYAFIYNGCNFITPETGATTIAMGRAWGKGMKMVVINSTIDKNYSTAAHTEGATKGQRYCTMSGNEPNPANMLEYNNTGDGAVSASVKNTCTYMTATQAADYGTDKLSTILGFTPKAE